MKLRIIRGYLVLTLFFSLAGCTVPGSLGAAHRSSAQIILHGGTVITAAGTGPIDAGIVVIEGSHILFVGSEGDVDIPSGAQVIDAVGKTILPGFIDAHVHSTSSPALRRAFLEDGITAICDLGTPMDSLAAFAQETLGESPAARGLHAGPILTARGGLPDAVLNGNLNYEVVTPAEGRAAVEDLHNRGVTQIKVYLQEESAGATHPTLDDATLKAIVDAAHDRGLPVRAHVTYISLLEMAIGAGVDSIEHVPINLTEAESQSISEEQLRRLFESSDPVQAFFDGGYPEYESQLQEMVDAGIIMVPTIDRPFGQLIRKPAPTQEESVYISIILGIVERFNHMGGNVALGTDYNLSTGLRTGMPIGELEMLLAAGLTPMEMIEAGTRYAAAACGQGERLGTLEPGKLADVIVVDGNPLADFMAMDDVILVIKEGEIAFVSEDAFGSP